MVSNCEKQEGKWMDMIVRLMVRNCENQEGIWMDTIVRHRWTLPEGVS